MTKKKQTWNEIKIAYPDESFIEHMDDWLFDRLPAWLYQLFKHQIPNIWTNIKWFLQRVFRKNHLSDVQLWNAYDTMLVRILPILEEYIKMNRHVYPPTFIDSPEDDMMTYGMSEEEIAEAFASGEFVKGGAEAWEEVLKEMLFGVKWYIVSSGSDRKAKKFCKEYGLPTDLLVNWHKASSDEWKQAHARAEQGMKYFHQHFFDLVD